MRRSLLYAVGVLGVVLLMFVPTLGIGSSDSSSQAAAETATITDYDAEFVVDDQGTLRATETLRVDFPVYKHGIFRFFDVADPIDDHVRFIPKDITVTRDGQPDGLDLSEEGHGRYVVARIGDPDLTIDGAHTYVIRYSVPGALSDIQSTSGGGAGSLFYWNPGSRWLADADHEVVAERHPARRSAAREVRGRGGQ